MAKQVTASSRQQWSWQLRIELLGVTPTVWRRLTVPESIKLPKLHKVFQTALGWTNSHLHEFHICGTKFSDPDPDFADELDQINEKNILLVKALGLEARCFDYLYDFGDSWHHVVVVEDQHPHPGIAPTLIHCSDGANACPPEDVGGTHGYSEFLEAIADSDHEDHDRLIRWVGGQFDPRQFDLDATNLALSKIKV
jgi:hypothetical protein